MFSHSTCLVAGSDTDDHLDSVLGEVATVASNNQNSTLSSGGDGIEGSLDEVLGVVLLLEDLDTLTETAGAWALAIEGLCGNGLDRGHLWQENGEGVCGKGGVRMVDGKGEKKRNEKKKKVRSPFDASQWTSRLPRIWL